MITWRLNEKQADYVMNVLAQRPWAEANPLIQELLKQANPPPTQAFSEPGQGLVGAQEPQRANGADNAPPTT